MYALHFCNFIRCRIKNIYHSYVSRWDNCFKVFEITSQSIIAGVLELNPETIINIKRTGFFRSNYWFGISMVYLLGPAIQKKVLYRWSYFNARGYFYGIKYNLKATTKNNSKNNSAGQVVSIHACLLPCIVIVFKVRHTPLNAINPISGIKRNRCLASIDSNVDSHYLTRLSRRTLSIIWFVSKGCVLNKNKK